MKRAALWPPLAAALLLQIAWHAWSPRARPHIEPLPSAPPDAVARLASLGDPLAAARGLMLYLQAHDDQAAGSTGLHTLDYTRIRGWLALALDLDPRSQYPLLAASEVYAAVNDPQRVRTMLDFVHTEFARDPQRRWPWMAQAAMVARHRLHDLPLASQYAHALREQAPNAPPWTHELEALFAEDANELDTARAIIGGLIASGQISDPNELRFLDAKLRALEAKNALRK